MTLGATHATHTSVMVVDDQAPFRHAVGSVARATVGFEAVAEACSGEEAVRVARGVRPDLMLVDLRMPGLDGVETSRRVAAAVPETVIVLVSAGEPPWSSANPPPCGAVAFMRKQDLRPDTLRAIWDRHRR